MVDTEGSSGAKPPGHASHTDGKDVDISVYDENGNPTWLAQCNLVGKECVRGTDYGMDVDAMARKIGALLDGERVTHVFLDREFHSRLFDAAEALAEMGELDDAHVPYMQSVVAHWPNHTNHIHVRYAVH